MTLQSQLIIDALEMIPTVYKHIKKASYHDRSQMMAITLRVIDRCKPALHYMTKEQLVDTENKLIKSFEEKGYLSLKE